MAHRRDRSEGIVRAARRRSHRSPTAPLC